MKKRSVKSSNFRRPNTTLFAKLEMPFKFIIIVGIDKYQLPFMS